MSMEASNKIISIDKELSKGSAPANLTIAGDVAEANLNFGLINHIFGCSPDSLLKDSKGTGFTPPPTFSRTRYSLIVAQSNCIDSKTVKIPIESFLVDTDKEIKDELYFCKDDSIAKLKTYPSLFALSDLNNVKAKNAGQVLFGYLSNIEVESSFIVCSFNGLSAYDRQNFLDIADSLDIGHAPVRTEFDRPHWAVKNKDLIGIAGIAFQFLSIFGISNGGA